jgi:hypothetical protein
MADVFDAEYVSLHVRVTNKGAFHLYTQTLGYECGPLLHARSRAEAALACWGGRASSACTPVVLADALGTPCAQHQRQGGKVLCGRRGRVRHAEEVETRKGEGGGRQGPGPQSQGVTVSCSQLRRRVWVRKARCFAGWSRCRSVRTARGFPWLQAACYRRHSFIKGPAHLACLAWHAG